MLLRFPDDSNNPDDFIVKELKEWVLSKAMTDLLDCFGFHCDKDDFGAYLQEVADFVNEEFDYISKTRRFASRLEQALVNHDIAWLNEHLLSINLYLERMGFDKAMNADDLANNSHQEDLLQHMRLKERFAVFDDETLIKNRSKLARLIEEIGTPGTNELIENGKKEALKSSWIVILGATAFTNRSRTRLAKELYDIACAADHPINVIGLSGERIVQRSELVKEHLDPETIMSEYDSLKNNIFREFNLADNGVETYSDVYLEQLQMHGRDYRKWDSSAFWRSSRKTVAEDRGNTVIVMSCPSSDPANRRANTYDTMDAMIQDCLSQDRKERLLLVGSARYAAYTIFTAWLIYRVKRGLDNISFAYTGNVGPIGERKMISSYLMEIRNGIHAGKALYDGMRLKMDMAR